MKVDSGDFLVEIVIYDKGEPVVDIVSPADSRGEAVVFSSSSGSGDFLVSSQVGDESSSVVNNNTSNSRAAVSNLFGVNVNSDTFSVDLFTNCIRDSLVVDLKALFLGELSEFLANQLFILKIVQLDFGDLVGVNVGKDHD